MNHLTLVCASAALALASASAGGVLASNLPTSPNGHAADAWSSGGTYASSQSIAASFTLTEASLLDGFTVWGASMSAIDPDLTNVAGVQLVIWNSDFSAQVLSATFTAAQLTLSQTGEQAQNGGFQYEISALLNSGPLAAGTYYLNAGAVLVDGATDPFQWSTGGSGSLYSNAFDGSGWTVNDSQTSPAFTLFGSAVPAPGAGLLFALAGLGGGRRRK